MNIRAVLFDLDGTLVDTAPDLVFALNRVCEERSMPTQSLAKIRPHISLGSKAFIKYALNIDENHRDFNQVRERFFAVYQEYLAHSSQLFPNIEKVLKYLEGNSIPWGIVTNKLTRHTTALLTKLGLEKRAACIISGDTLPYYKPDPQPLMHACKLLKKPPKKCLYIGDAASDVVASKAAGIHSLVALYGYINPDDEPLLWQADGYVNEPLEIIDWLTRNTSKFP